MGNLTYQKLDLAIDKYDLILFDLWGVIVENGETYTGVVDAINKINEQTNIIFLTNAPRPNFKVAESLRHWGLKNITDDMVVTSGDIARQKILDYRFAGGFYSDNSDFSNDLSKSNISKKFGIGNKLPKIYHLGEDRNKDVLIDFEYEATQDLDNSDILLLSLYRDDHEDINEFNQMLEQAAHKKDLLILCSNPDTTIPKHGAIRYCAGYFAQIIEKFGGTVTYTGKPKQIIYDHVLKNYNHIDKKRILMVGDTFETDIMGANAANISSALVLSGNAQPFHDMHESMEMKLSALYDRAKLVGAMPSFVTSLV